MSVDGGGRGIMLVLDITGTPNNAETLTPSIQVYDLISGKYQTLTAFGASKTGTELGASPTTATLCYSLYPGGLETAAVANHEVQGLAVPTRWRAQITHSSTGSWTYSLSYQTLL
jgi:hypothetical protein